MDATSPTICYHTTIYADPATTWDYEISSHRCGGIGEREAKLGVRSMPPKIQAKRNWLHRVRQNQIQILGSDFQPRQHLSLQPYEIGYLVVRE